MKRLLIALAGIILIAACKKEQIKLYQDTDPSLYFTLTTYSYSFMTDLDSTSRVIYLPVKLSGALKDYDRSFTMQVINDTNTTANKDWYELKQGTLPKNSVNGTIPIVLKRNVTIDTSIIKLKLVLTPSSTLDTMPNATIQLSWTGKIIQPINWNWLRYYFGTPFSTAWYKFIIKTTGRSSFPYSPTLARTDPATWNMTQPQIQAYTLQVKEALQSYNAANPDNPLTHDDGIYKGQLVSMP
ncbi:DUF4843 domain-containing protein [Chitinophaga eiseniae]|uniref:DUF4843 domain-containing protein n=1 Tax=Chitinophaga eiseniae TaxID=634771 RepID=A0A847SF65_9BACT|nr:DUF4843 domain-containing protein [Chitinophaga eiseniae]NLR80431.1 DUF4843 domain-containing protein [Chitinophaga eiseniae]